MSLQFSFIILLIDNFIRYVLNKIMHYIINYINSLYNNFGDIILIFFLNWVIIINLIYNLLQYSKPHFLLSMVLVKSTHSS